MSDETNEAPEAPAEPEVPGVDEASDVQAPSEVQAASEVPDAAGKWRLCDGRACRMADARYHGARG